MKPLVLIIIFYFATLVSNGQVRNDTTVTINYIDSLKREIANLKQNNNFLYWGYQEKANVSKVDTVFIRSDSSVITYYSKDGKLLRRQFNNLDTNNDVVQYAIHYFDYKNRVSYIEVWQTLKDDYFDGKLSSAERFEYDSLSRPTLSVKYLQSVRRTIRKTFYYYQNRKSQTKTDIIKGYALWNE